MYALPNFFFNLIDVFCKLTTIMELEDKENAPPLNTSNLFHINTADIKNNERRSPLKRIIDPWHENKVLQLTSQSTSIKRKTQIIENCTVLEKTICQVCFTNFENKKKCKTALLCPSCKYFYYEYIKTNENVYVCEGRQDCVISPKVRGCLKCRAIKSEPVLKSNSISTTKKAGFNLCHQCFSEIDNF